MQSQSGLSFHYYAAACLHDEFSSRLIEAKIMMISVAGHDQSFPGCITGPKFVPPTESGITLGTLP
jgi:hypothetical protein